MIKLKNQFESNTRFTYAEIIQAQGPSWTVPLGRRDGLTANRTLANQNLPAPFNSLDQLKAAFTAQGLNTTDLVALSGSCSF
jgi:peroxidase